MKISKIFKASIYFIILFNVSFFSCTNKKIEDKTQESDVDKSIIHLTDEQIKNAGIEVANLESRFISEVLKLNGRIDVPPQNLISISMPLGGYVKSTPLLPGMHIRKGQVLAVMEDQLYIRLQQDFLTAKSQMELISIEYERQKDLNKTKASSDKVLEQAKANYQSQSVLLKSLEQQLQMISINPDKLTPENISGSTKLLSPINGYVSAVNVNIGKYVSPTDVLFELVNPDDIHLNLTVYEKDVSNLFVGQKLYTYTNNQPDVKYLCEIILISKKLGANNSVEVQCHFAKYDKKLIPGTFMNAEVEIKGNQTLAISENAVLRFENKNYVFISKDSNNFQMTEVTIGKSENGYIELVNAEDLKNSSIVIKGAYDLLMSLKNTND